MPPNPSEKQIDEMYRAYQAKSMGPEQQAQEPSLSEAWENAKGNLAKPVGEQASNLWKEVWHRNPNATGDEMGAAGLMVPNAASGLMGAAEEAPAVIERFSRLPGMAEGAAEVAPAAAEAGHKAGGLLGLIKDKLGPVGIGVALERVGEKAAEKLWHHREEIGDMAAGGAVAVLPDAVTDYGSKAIEKVGELTGGNDPGPVHQRTEADWDAAYAAYRKGSK